MVFNEGIFGSLYVTKTLFHTFPIAIFNDTK